MIRVGEVVMTNRRLPGAAASPSMRRSGTHGIGHSHAEVLACPKPPSDHPDELPKAVSGNVESPSGRPAPGSGAWLPETAFGPHARGTEDAAEQ
jgi:hypothetical protein